MANQSEKVLAIIPARGGSKGLPGKNIRPFCGIPLVYHSFLCALRIPEVTDIVITSDSEEVLAAGCPDQDLWVRRPPELAQDDTPVWEAIRHALAEREMSCGGLPPMPKAARPWFRQPRRR